MLPELQGADFWWKALPPSVKLKGSITPASDVVSDASPESTRDGAGSKTGNSGETGKRAMEVVLEKRRRVEKGDTAPRKKINAGDDEDVDENGAGPSNPKGKDREEPKVCDACRHRGSKCMWLTPTKASSSSSNGKRACSACVLQKTRCNIRGIFSIRRPRGKAAATQLRSNECPERSLAVLNSRITELENMLAEGDEETLQLASTVADLVSRFTELKRKVHMF